MSGAVGGASSQRDLVKGASRAHTAEPSCVSLVAPPLRCPGPWTCGLETDGTVHADISTCHSFAVPCQGPCAGLHPEKQ